MEVTAFLSSYFKRQRQGQSGKWEQVTRSRRCVWKCVVHAGTRRWVICCRVWFFATARLLCPWNSPGKNTRVGSHSLLQGISLTQGLNPSSLHFRQIPYHLSHQGTWSMLKIKPNHSFITTHPRVEPFKGTRQVREHKTFKTCKPLLCDNVLRNWIKKQTKGPWL